MRFRYLIFLTFIAVHLYPFSVTAQQWVVPDDQKGKVAPFLFTPDMQKQGENLYNKNCASCHGVPGKDNWVKQLSPPPGDLAQGKAQGNSDGEMFYKLTMGKAPMPEFRNILSEEERWWVIAYLRTFNKEYIQPNPAGKGSFAGKIIKLQMVIDTIEKRIEVRAMEMTKEKNLVPAKGVEILLFVKRFFGNRQIGDPKTTGEQGAASFDFPADIPGDKEGKVELTCRVNDASGSISSSPVTTTSRIGVPTDRPGLTETRAWWSTRDKAPVWIIITYLSTVIIVWGIIFYILFSILKIRKLNTK
jgi:mono/diheme cytochrome c family protein